MSRLHGNRLAAADSNRLVAAVDNRLVTPTNKTKANRTFTHATDRKMKHLLLSATDRI